MLILIRSNTHEQTHSHFSFLCLKTFVLFLFTKKMSLFHKIFASAFFRNFIDILNKLINCVKTENPTDLCNILTTTNF